MTYNKEVLGTQFTLELSSYALDIVSRVNDVSEAISLLLKKVGEKFSLSHITVLEKQRNLPCFMATYEWYTSEIEPIRNHVITFSEEQKNIFLERIDQSEEIFTYEELKEMKEAKKMISTMKQNKADNMILCALKQNNKFIGFINFETRNKIESFSEEELSAFLQTKRILENFFLVCRANQEAQKRIEQVTLFDPVTGLMKYDSFLEQAELIYKNDSNNQYIMFYADITNFKYFNETYGYAAGDEVLRLFKQHFLSLSSSYIIGCRIFSDYFIGMTVLKEPLVERKLIQEIQMINYSFQKKIQSIYPESSIHIVSGVVLIDNKNLDIQTYIDNANQARKIAKYNRTICVIFNKDMEAERKKYYRITSIAEEALKNDEFYFELQPKIDLKTKKTVGAEALVRWSRQDGTVVYPNEFVPIFEQNGFITKLDFYVYDKVCEYLLHRISHGKEVVPISVNVSRAHLKQDNFAKKVIRLVEQHRIAPEYLEFELTENIFLENSEQAKETLIELKNYGFKVSMDDFGSGYSSLNLLMNLEFDILKLDKDFLTDNIISKKEEVVIKSIIRMAKLMNMTVLCEGVETKEQVDFLERIQCDMVQGYYFGRPMKTEAFEECICS
ncbi:putative bifunctional diguanylate cyclase/phosphodiesterase [Lachnoclostridium phytofermentans]|uniref:Diguanylate cyclase/phosphodiesterase n=1 Tax=Lachnoclostridium phytofermentans (strain ATCC 700394 / DSM 18823 / ISDg) TaxID=357809 RepID=A9KP25_LACP7|nr:bifunctional diguanylate cyclase/phosphodiesterase [Lachnoclostridium phytofermentans]ABX43195.1 diguanylate cyclase/phosphodiesterase [Lachnoclostridium phytofermentans ISDg]